MTITSKKHIDNLPIIGDMLAPDEWAVTCPVCNATFDLTEIIEDNICPVCNKRTNQLQS